MKDYKLQKWRLQKARAVRTLEQRTFGNPPIGDIKKRDVTKMTEDAELAHTRSVLKSASNGSKAKITLAPMPWDDNK